MNDIEKVRRLELALRTERDLLRQKPGPENVKAANILNEYVQNASAESKLRFANLILGVISKEEAYEAKLKGDKIPKHGLRLADVR